MSASGEHETKLQTGACQVAAEVALEYAVAGPSDAEPVLLVHGNGPNWRQFTPQLEALAGGWRVFAVSLRGHGGSTMPVAAAKEDFTLPRLAHDIVALLDTLGIDRCHLIGNSVGGLVGFELVGSHPTRLASLVTFGTTAELNSGRAMVRTVTGMTRLLRPRGIGWVVGRTVTDRNAGRRISALIADADPRALRLLTHNVAAYDYRPVLETSTIPWLLLRGARDQSVNKVLDSTLAVVDSRADAHWAEMPDAGHFANLEAPEEFNSLVRGFLSHYPVSTA